MHGCASNVNRLKRTSALVKGELKALLWPVVLILIVVALDQFSKIWAVNALSLKPSWHVIGDYFMFTLVYNDGGALGTSFGPSHYYLVSSSLILLFVFYYLYQNRHDLFTAVPLSLIAGGAIGNIIDRVRIEKVIDFIDIDIPDINLFGYHLERWWTFNIADAAISCSILFLLANILFFHERPVVSEPAPSEHESKPNFSNTDNTMGKSFEAD